MPLISVIIPAFNSERTIQETINSVLCQTVSDFEIIIINDGSQDSTLEAISSISDHRIAVFSYPNMGVSASRNRGLRYASGDYIAFLDADDLWTPDKLESQLKALRSRPEAAVAYSWTDWIDQFGKFLRPGGHITKNGNVHSDLLLRDFVESGSNPLIRKEALIKVGNFNESLSAAADWEMWLRLAALYEFVAVPSPQILYRVSSQSMSTNVWKMEAESLQVIEQALDRVPESRSQKRQILGQRYQYLTLKALEGPLERRRGIVAGRFLMQAISNDPTWLLRPQLMLIILLKIGTALVLHEQKSQVLRQWIKRLSHKEQKSSEQLQS